MTALLSTMDRLWSNAHNPMKKLKPNFNIPVVDVQHKVEDDLRDQIELLNLKLHDADESLEAMGDLNANLNLRNAELSAKLEQEQQYRLKQSDNAFELNKAEQRIVDLEKKLLTEMGNRDHFRALVAEQDRLIKELKTKMAKEEDEHKRILEARKNEVDHLARQCVRVNEENSTLKTDNCKFKEQTTRLIEENRKLNDKVNNLECQGCRTGEHGTYCGGCLGCLTRQAEYAMHETDKALTRRDEELAHERNVGMKRWQMVEALSDAIRQLRSLPFWSVREKKSIIHSAQNKVITLQDEAEAMRKKFYKVKN